MGANQSGGQATNQDTVSVHRITVVHPNPNGQEPSEKNTIQLPPKSPPILSVDGHAIDPNRHGPQYRLNQQLWVDFVTLIERFSNSRADLVATRQSQLQEKITQVDEHVQRFTDSYINDKHKALAKLNDDCKKIDEIGKMLEKCTIQSELTFGMLNKLNFILPEEHKLEPLEMI